MRQGLVDDHQSDCEAATDDSDIDDVLQALLMRRRHAQAAVKSVETFRFSKGDSNQEGSDHSTDSDIQHATGASG